MLTPSRSQRTVTTAKAELSRARKRGHGRSVIVVTGMEVVFRDIKGITSQEANEKHK